VANDVKLTIRVSDNGSLDVVQKKAKAAADSLGGLGKAQRKAGDAADHYQKKQKGVGQTGLSSAKAFSKMSTGISGGLVPAYATLAANVFAVTAAFGALQRAQATAQLEEGLKIVGQAAGQNLPYVASQLKNITGAAVSMKQAMESTALAISAGFSTDQLKGLTKVAKGASLALGRDMGDALTRLTKGAAKLEPEILDELGILVRLDEASQKYADDNDKVVDSLTRFEKQQAFVNAILDQGGKKFDLIANSVEANPYDKLAASFADLNKILLQIVGNVLEPLVSLLAKNPVALLSVLTMFGSTIVKSILPAVSDLAAKQKEIAAQAAVMAKKASTVISTKYKEAQAVVKKLDFSISPKYVQSLEKQFKSGKISAEELKKSITTLKISETQRNKQNIKYSGEALRNYKAETAAIVEQRMALEGLSAADKQKYTRGAASAEAKKASSVKGLTARGFSEMERATTLTDKWRAAIKYTGLQIEGMNDKHNKGVKGLARLNLGFKAAAGGAMLMGSAMLNMIPIIGQILFIASLLGPIIYKLFEKGAAAKAADEATEAFKNTTAITTQLTAKLETLTKVEEKYQAILKVRAGLMSSINAGISGVVDAQIKDDMENLTDLKLAQINAEEVALKASKGGNRASQGLKDKTAKDALKAQKAYATALAETSKVEAETVKNMLASQVVRMQVGKGAEYFAEEIKILTDEINALEGKENLSPEYIKEMQNRVKGVIALQQETETVTKGFEELGKISARDAAKQKGHGAKYVDALSTIEKSLVRVREAEAKEGDIPVIVSPKDLAVLHGMASALGINVHYAMDLETQVALTKDAYQKQLDLQITLVEQSKQQKTLATEIGKVSANNGALKELELSYVKKSLESDKARLESKLKTTRVENGNVKQAEDYKKIEAELATVERKILGTSEDTLLVRKADNAEAKRSLDLTKKILSAETKIHDIKMAAARRAIDLKRIQQGVSVNAMDELKLLQDRIKAETDGDETSLRARQEQAELQTINLEFELLEIQFLLERKKIERLAKEKDLTEDEKTALTNSLSSFTNIENRLDQAKKISAKAVTDKFEDKAAKDAYDLAVAKDKVERETRQLERDWYDEQIQSAKDLGNTELAASLTILTLREKLSELEKEAEKISNAKGNNEVSAAEKALEIAKQKRLIAKEERAQYFSDIERFGGATGSKTVATGMKNRAKQEERENQIKTLEDALEVAEIKHGKASEEARKAQAALDAANAANKRALFLEASDTMKALAEDIRRVGPEGEAMAAVLDGAAALTEAFTLMGAAGKTAFDKVQAGLAVAGAMVNMLSQVQKAASAQKIKAIDGEIAAEKNRDGQSSASVEKIKSLEKKKEQAARKSFEQQKKMKMAQVAIATATGAMEAYASAQALPAPFGPIVGGILAGLVVAMGAKTMSQIASSTYQGGSSAGGSGAGAPTSMSMGKRGSSADMAKSQSASGELAYFRGQDGTGGAENFKPAFSGAKYRGAGGNVGFVVGERGPELFVPETPGRVVANDDIGEGNVQAITFNINTVDATGVEELLVEQRGNIIGMLRDASNSYGEPFMEKVDTSSMTPTQGAGLFGGGIERAYGSNTFKRR